jgi:Protein of unknown function (DUF3489)
MNTSLTETQKSILIAAAERPDRRIDWFPDGVKGGARAKVLASLQSKGLITTNGDQPVISEAGLAALGLPPAQIAPPDAPKPRKVRENTKHATVIALLQRPEGATLEQLIAATGWEKHSIRGALSLLGKRQGLVIVSEKTEAGRVYRNEIPSSQ